MAAIQEGVTSVLEDDEVILFLYFIVWKLLIYFTIIQ